MATTRPTSSLSTYGFAAAAPTVVVRHCTRGRMRSIRVARPRRTTTTPRTGERLMDTTERRRRLPTFVLALIVPVVAITAAVITLNVTTDDGDPAAAGATRAGSNT